MPRTNQDVMNALQTPDDLINEFAVIHEVLGGAVGNIAA